MSDRRTPPGYDEGWWQRTMDEFARLANEARPERLDFEFARLAAIAGDCEVAELIELALSPLPVVDEEALTAAARPPRPMPLPGLDRLVVPDRIVAEVAAHASEASAAMEVGGKLVVGPQGHVRAYRRLRNLATVPHRFRPGPASVRLEPGHFTVPLHSHPPGTVGEPSPADHRLIRRDGSLGILHVESGTLAVFVADLTGSGIDELPVEIARTQTSPHGGYVIHLAERLVYDRFGEVVAGGWPLVERHLLRRSSRRRGRRR
jgi:hypothetical protein